MKFDDIVVQLGEFGPYQKWIYFLLCLPAITSAFGMLSTVFILSVPDHRCSVPYLKNDSYAIRNGHQAEIVSKTIPLEKDGDTSKYSQCEIFDTSIPSSFVRNKTTPCDNWVYNKEVFLSTVITDFSMVCSEKELRSHANMILMAGLLVGSLGLGLLSDFIGRKKTFMFALVVSTGANFGQAFALNFAGFVSLRFLMGAANMGAFMCLFVIGMEFVGPSKRTTAGIVIEMFWCAGLFILGGIAYGIRNWRYLQVAISIPPVVFFSYWWLIPESPRWLISKGRLDEASAIIKKAAAFNKVKLPPKMLNLENLEMEKEEKIWRMFRSPILVYRSLIIFFNWCVVSMVYYGLGLNVGSLGGNIYVNFTIANIVEAVSYVGCILLLDRTGRKKLHCLTMVIGGVACICTLFPVLYASKSNDWITTALAMIGKLGISAAFAIIYVYSAELFPTIVRNSGMGCSSFCARIGGMVSPYIADLGNLVEGDFSKALPLIIFGILSVAAGLLSLCLPETLNKQLPESIDDAKRFGRDNLEKNCHNDNPAESSPSVPKKLKIPTEPSVTSSNEHLTYKRYLGHTADVWEGTRNMAYSGETEI